MREFSKSEKMGAKFMRTTLSADDGRYRARISLTSGGGNGRSSPLSVCGVLLLTL